MEQNESAKQAAPSYDTKAALEFFRSEGEIDTFDAGGVIFSENEKAGRFSLKRNKMYLLLEGQVNLIANGNFLGMVGPGEMFGEMASLSQAPRSASAMARAACRVISLDDKQFQNALKRQPEFALMVMGMIIRRLRKSPAQVKKDDSVSGDTSQTESRIFERKLLAELLEELGDDARVQYDQGRIIMQEGQIGVLKYIVLEGRVSIVIKGTVVEQVGAGAVFGEMALVEKGPRLVSAVADTHFTLLGINRTAFLDLVKRKPQFGMALLSAIGERARVTTTRI